MPKGAYVLTCTAVPPRGGPEDPPAGPPDIEEENARQIVVSIARKWTKPRISRETTKEQQGYFEKPATPGSRFDQSI